MIRRSRSRSRSRIQSDFYHQWLTVDIPDHTALIQDPPQSRLISLLIPLHFGSYRLHPAGGPDFVSQVIVGGIFG